jgi:hypothetical protein
MFALAAMGVLAGWTKASAVMHQPRHRGSCRTRIGKIRSRQRPGRLAHCLRQGSRLVSLL